MIAKSEFETLETLYQAIVDIDRSINRTRDDKFATSLLEDVMNDIKFINKNEFGKEYVLPIVKNIRSAVVEMYQKQQDLINSSLNDPNIGRTTKRVESDNNDLMFPIKEPQISLPEKEDNNTIHTFGAKIELVKKEDDNYTPVNKLCTKTIQTTEKDDNDDMFGELNTKITTLF